MSETLEFDIVVVGGGAVGLAIARELSSKGSVLLLERHDRLGTETSARNSEVIHAGIYYPANSMKEKFCIEGRELLYAYCSEKNVEHRNCGKLVVAHDEAESAYLEKISANCKRNGVPTSFVDSKWLEREEPRVLAKTALLSPTTGIVDSETFMQALATDCDEAGVTTVTRSKALSWEKTTAGYDVLVEQPGGDQFTARTKILVNSAGLGSYEFAKPAFGNTPPFLMKFIRGHYMTLSMRWKECTKRLIYPVPDTKGGGLGIHLTLDTHGDARLGPDTDWRYADKPDHRFFEEDTAPLRAKFFTAARRYLKDLREEEISAGFVGVRPKLVALDGKTQLGDFYIQEESARGFAALINLVGIESPGLTSSLAIARHLKNLI